MLIVTSAWWCDGGDAMVGRMWPATTDATAAKTAAEQHQQNRARDRRREREDMGGSLATTSAPGDGGRSISRGRGRRDEDPGGIDDRPSSRAAEPARV
jgi:hypothetical protein